MALKITWTDNNASEQGHRIYISDQPMDPDNLPTPHGEAGPDITEYLALDIDDEAEWHIIVSAFRGASEVLSDPLHYDPTDPGPGPGPTGEIIGVVLIQTDVAGGVMAHIDEAGNTIASPDTAWFDARAPWAGMVDEVIDGQHMVKIPKFYYRRGPITAGEHAGRDAWWISPSPAPGFKVHPAFEFGGNEVDQFWYGKYQGYVEGGKLCSIPGVTPTRSRSITQFLADGFARNVGGVNGFRMHHVNMVSAIQWLALIEAASFDSKQVYGAGRPSSASPAPVDAADTAEASYRGIIGAWGNIWQWCDGLRMTSGGYLERRGYESGVLTFGWTGLFNRVSSSAHSPISFRSDAAVDDLFITATAGPLLGSVTLPEYVGYTGGGTVYLYVGGGNTAGYQGLWSVSVYDSATLTYTVIGSRLARVL